VIEGIYELSDLKSLIGDLKDKKALVKVDFNVPIIDGEITDDLRIKAALPTIKWLQDKGVVVTLCSHLGRPGGKEDQEFSLEPVRLRLKELGIEAKLLPNLRFNAGEKTMDKEFIASLVNGQDFFVNDAFGVSHRAEASSVGPTETLPSVAGFLIIEELKQLTSLLDNPKPPFVAVLGGLKISDKLPIVESLLAKVDKLLIGGAMAFTFLKSKGINVGGSLVEDSMIDTCKKLLDSTDKIVLPTDFVAIQEGGSIGKIDDSLVENFSNEIPDGWEGADIGPETSAVFSETISEAGTVFWNGPVGAFEDPRFAAGTSVVADALGDSEAFTMVGGGDSAAAAAEFGLAEAMNHISTGGGACLKFIETSSLASLEALKNSKVKNNG